MPRYAVVFDGECGICSRSVAWLREADREERFEILPFQDAAVFERFPSLTRAECNEAMQLFAPDGTRWEGARAVEEIVRILPGWKALAPLFLIPGVRIAARAVYRQVARNRGRLGCGEHCSVRPPADSI